MYEFLDKRYALALYDVAEEKGKVDEFLKDFEDIVNLFKNNKECKTLISHPDISTKEKRDIFIKMFKGKIDDQLLSFLLILIDKGRIEFAEEKFKEMKKIFLKRNNALTVEVRTTIPLEQDDRDNLTNKLRNTYGKQIMLSEKIDKSLIGGVYLRVGNNVIDGTIKNKLEELKEFVTNRKTR